MKSILLFLFLIFSLSAFSQKKETRKTMLYVIGSVHFPTKNINADTIYNAILTVKPDLILMEAGSQDFNKDYTFKKYFDENEYNAILKYKSKFPKTNIRPFDIEHRNEKRKRLGINGDNKASYFIDKRDSLHLLSTDQAEIWNKFVLVAEKLDLYSDKSLKEINCSTTDNLVSERQFYQYKKLTEIINSIQEFNNIIGSPNDTISLKEYNNRFCNFELQRNFEMSVNITSYLKKYTDKKILVITGFYHRYAILDLLRYEQEKYDFELKEYYE